MLEQALQEKFGVEIEMLVPMSVSRAQLVAGLTAAGTPTIDAGYTHVGMPTWKIVTDASLSGERGFYPIELVSPSQPPLQGEEGFAQVTAAGTYLLSIGAKVNRSCGLHVHVNATTMPVDTMQRLATIYAHSESMLDQLMPLSRRGNNNTYCRSIANASREDIARASSASAIAAVLMGQQSSYGYGASRYGKLNFMAWNRHRTVEFRHHSGTVDPHKILFWVKMCLRLVHFASTSTMSFATGEAMPATVRAGTKRALLLELLMRPEGAMRYELLRATGARTLSLGALSKASGVRITRGYRRRGGQTRYHAEVARRVTLTTAQNEEPLPMTFEAFTARLALPEDEINFWNARRAFLSAAHDRNFTDLVAPTA